MINSTILKNIFNLHRIKENVFLKNVLFVSGGTMFAQLIVLLFSPIISRIYTSTDFGVFQQYQAILSFLLVISGLRYEMAIFLPKENKDAYSILVLSLLINVCFSIFLLLAIAILRSIDYSFSFLNGILNLVYFIPFAILGASIYQSLNNMVIREKDFKQIGITKITQSSGLIGGQVLIGYYIDKAIGLIWGDLISKFLGISTFVKALLKKNKLLLLHTNFKKLKSLGYEYRKFPLVSVPSGLLNVAGITISTFFIGNFWGLSALGFYALVDRIFSAPSMLIGQSVSQVYMGEFVKLSYTNPEALLARFLNLIKKISLITILPYTFAAILAPYLFGWIFGYQWSEAGIYFAILAPMQFVGIIAWPLIPTLNLLERQSWQLAWDIFRLLLVIMVLSITHHYNISTRMSLFCFGMAMLLSYLIHLGLSFIALKIRVKQHKHGI